MRTTINLEAPLLKELRERQKREGGTLSALVSRLLAAAMAQASPGGRAPKLRWKSRRMGARVDLADKDAVYAILDRPDRAADR
jgi:hypothetical protein